MKRKMSGFPVEVLKKNGWSVRGACGIGGGPLEGGPHDSRTQQANWGGPSRHGNNIGKTIDKTKGYLRKRIPSYILAD